MTTSLAILLGILISIFIILLIHSYKIIKMEYKVNLMWLQSQSQKRLAVDDKILRSINE